MLGGTALALAWLRRPSEALPLAKRAVASSPNAEFARFVLGLTFVMLGRSDEAIAELNAVERLTPNGQMATRSWKWRSIAHLQAGRLDQALEAADPFVQLLPESEALIQSVLCLAKLNDWNRAREAMRRLRDTDPELSCTLTQNLVRGLYCGSKPAQVEELVTIVRRLWDETPGKACTS